MRSNDFLLNNLSWKKVCSAIKQFPIFRSRLMSNCWIRVRETDLRKDRGKNEHFMHFKNYFCALNPFDIYGHILGDNLYLFRVFGVLYRGISSAGRFLWSYSLQYSNKFNIPWTSLQDYGLFIVLFGSFCVPSINLYNTQSILTNSTSNSKGFALAFLTSLGLALEIGFLWRSQLYLIISPALQIED